MVIFCRKQVIIFLISSPWSCLWPIHRQVCPEYVYHAWAVPQSFLLLHHIWNLWYSIASGLAWVHCERNRHKRVALPGTVATDQYRNRLVSLWFHPLRFVYGLFLLLYSQAIDKPSQKVFDKFSLSPYDLSFLKIYILFANSTDKFFSRLEWRYVVFWNNYCSVLWNIASGFCCPVLQDETSEASKIDRLTFFERWFNFNHECFKYT